MTEMTSGAKPWFTMEELIALPAFSGLAIRGDGEFAAYVERTVDWENNAFSTHVWLYDAAAQRKYPVTVGDKQSKQAAWASAGLQFGYLQSSGVGKDLRWQLHVTHDELTPGVKVTSFEEGVHDWQWAPDGRFLYCTTAPKSEKRTERDKVYGDFSYVDMEYRRKRLYRVDVEKALEEARLASQLPKDARKSLADDELARPLTDGVQFDVQGFQVSPSGNLVVMITAPSPNMEDLDKRSVRILNVLTGDLRTVELPYPTAGNVMFSPDERALCVTVFTGTGKSYENVALMKCDLSTGNTALLDAGIDESLYPEVWGEAGILMWWQDGTTCKAGWLDENGGLRPLVSQSGESIQSVAATLDGQHTVTVRWSATEASEVLFDNRPVSDVRTVFAQKLTSKKSVIDWTSQDGTRVEGVLSLPPDVEEDKQYPLLVVVHGGPTAASFPIPGSGRLYPIEQFVERGFIVLEPNYRGSTGYGRAFRQLNVRNLGLGDYDDVISGVDELIRRGIADPNRVGVMGWSQGGYISAFCTTYSRRFKAVSVGAGISNWMTYYVNTDIHQFTRTYLESTPWEDEEVYKRTSPMTYIKQAGTPTLIQHGDNDARVPVPNAYELYQGLRDNDVSTQLVIFHGMPHGPHKPGLNRAIMKQNFAWFCHHLLGDALTGFTLD